MKKIKYIIFFFLLLVVSSCNKSQRTLYVYTWSDYISPDVVEAFEKKYNCRIVMDYFESNEAMFAKLKVCGADTYDVIFPTSYMASIMDKGNMILHIDKSKMPNLKYLDYKYIEKTEDPEAIYSVPYATSFTGIGYNKSKVQNFKPTFGVFGDTGYYRQVTMVNDMRAAIGSALKNLGYSMNTTSDTELQEAKKLLLKWKKNIAAFQNDESRTSLAYNIIPIIETYNGEITQMQEDNPDLVFAAPEEGSMMSVETMVIPTGAKNKQLAYDFINFLYEPENSKKNMEFISYLCPNTEALKMIDKNFLDKLTIPDDIYRRTEVYKDLGKDNEKYFKIWDEVLADPN